MMPSTDFSSEQQLTFASTNNVATMTGNQQQQYQQPPYSTLLDMDTTGSTLSNTSSVKPFISPHQQQHSYQLPHHDTSVHPKLGYPTGSSNIYKPYYDSQMPPLNPVSHIQPVGRSVVDTILDNNSPPKIAGGDLLSGELDLGSSITPIGRNYTNPSPTNLSPLSSIMSTSSNMTRTLPTQQQQAINGEPTAMEIDSDVKLKPEIAWEPAEPSPDAANNRKRGVSVPEALKDEKYRESRLKNNLSVNKSRKKHHKRAEWDQAELVKLKEEHEELARVQQLSKRLKVRSMCEMHRQLTGKYPWEDIAVRGVRFQKMLPIPDFLNNNN